MRTTISRKATMGFLAVLLVGVIASAAAAALDQDELSRRLTGARAGRTRAVPTKTPPAPVRDTFLLGRSVQGRPIRAVEAGRRHRPIILVVGCIHGNEPAGIAVARDLATDPAPRHLLLWLVPEVNPDGVAAGTRQNARGVDLNRNFPWGWQPIGHPGDLHYSGPRPLSEPESRIASALILRIRPDVTIWFHQHQDVVDLSGGSAAIERRYARLTGMPIARLPRYPGSAAGWQDHRLPGTTAFVVELPAGSLDGRGVERFSDAVLRLL